MTRSSPDIRPSRVRAALAWGRKQAGEGEATAYAERAAALAFAPRLSPVDLAWARQLADRAAAAHIAYAALAGLLAAAGQRDVDTGLARVEPP